MNRRSLGIIAVIIILLMVVVATAGLDNLPRQLHESVSAANGHLTSDRAAFDRDREFIEKALRDEPELFASKVALWQSRIGQDRSQFDRAGAELATLQQLAKANKRSDADAVRRDLADFDSLRQAPVSDIAKVRAEAERWLQYKRDLPQRAAAMKASYDAIRSFNIEAATPKATKALTDWPAKKDDLKGRLDALRATQADGEKIWTDTAQAREAAEKGNPPAGFDYAAFFQSADKLDADAKQLPEQARGVEALAAQLYTSWDKILVDAGDDRDRYREKFKFVRTEYADSSLANGKTSSDEKWEQVDRSQYRLAERQVGMTVERKAAGKYDSEAERVVQPPAYAYIAPPGQSNQYGSWSNGVWHWLPAYLILSQLLHSSRPPITTYDYDAYRDARSRGSIFYGRNNEYRPTWHLPRSIPNVGGGSRSSSSGGPSGGWYRERPRDPSFGERGGFGGSKYQSRGTFGGSRYQSRGTFGSRAPSRGFGGGMRSFGRGGRR